jgi:hypothetical protein
MSFLLRYAASLPFADASKIAAMGHGYGAQAVLAWRALPNSPLDAVVILDSTLAYAAFDSLRFTRVKEAVGRNTKSAVPVLLFADRERHPRFETFDPYLKFAARYDVAAPALPASAFVSQGHIGKEDETRHTWETVCEVTLKFLDGHLRGNADALQGLRASNAAAPLHIHYRAGAPPPPTGAQIIRLYRAEDAAKPQALTALLKIAEPDAIVNAASILFDGDEKKQAIELLQHAAKLHTHSALLQHALGDALQRSGDSAGAGAAYDKTLDLLGADESLTDGEKADLRLFIEGARKKER